MAEISSRDGHFPWLSLMMYNVPLNENNESMIVYPAGGDHGLSNAPGDKTGREGGSPTWYVLDEGAPGVFLHPVHLLAIYAGRNVVEFLLSLSGGPLLLTFGG